MEKRKFAVLGLGVFGKTIAEVIAENQAEVIAIDENMEEVEAIANQVELAVQGDFTRLDTLEEAGVADCDVAIVSTTEKLETAILTIMNLEQLGIKTIIVKARSLDHIEVLERVGAHRVLIPEVEMGRFFGKELTNTSFRKILHLDEKFDVVEFRANKKWIGQTIDEIDFRKRYGLNIIAMRPGENEDMTIQINPQHKITEEDIFFGLTDDTASIQAFL